MSSSLRTLPFDPWKRCDGHLALWALPSFVDTYIETENDLTEAKVKKGVIARRGKPRTAAQTASLTALLNAYLANLVEAAVKGFAGVSVSLNKADLCKAPTRYNLRVKDVEREQFISVTAVLKKAKAIHVTPGEKGTWLITVYDFETGITSQRPRRRTRVQLSSSYLEALKRTMGVNRSWTEVETQAWFQRFEGEEVVLVKDDDTEELVDYPDNPIADAWRLKVKRYNNALNASDICHPENDGGGRIVLQTRFVEAPAGEPWDSLGGRLYGTNSFTAPFWYSMSGEDKLDMTIDGEPVVHLDFKAFAPTLAYQLRGMEVTSDPYLAVPGHPRHVVKTVMNAMLSARPRRDGTHEFKGAFNDSGDGIVLTLDQLNAVVAAVEKAHPALHDAFFIGGWKTIQNREVKIVFGAAMELLDKGVIACVMHDALYVAIEHEVEALEVLHARYRAITGHSPLLVTCETKVDRYKRAHAST